MEEEEEDNESKELLGYGITQAIPTVSTLSSKKHVIELENEDKDISESKNSTDMSAFEAHPFKKAKAEVFLKKSSEGRKEKRKRKYSTKREPR
eukprot:7230587-Ditylum_brightwellii.AAC.1